MKCPKCNEENPAGSRFCNKCATQFALTEGAPISHTRTLEMPSQELDVGSIFAGRYQIIEEIGRGGMGRVYKVLDKDIDEKVALKLLNPEIASDEKTIKRFRNELKFARKITHKNVCRMYDLNEKEGTPYITMEYVPGEDLKSSIRRMEQLTIGKAVSIAKQICEGLAEAHRLGVVHRDLKPQNIMIDSEGNAHIMDFGISLSLEAKGVTDAGMIIGTPEYMSPEQVEGKQADKRSDVYSLGVIIYEMVTGRVPFTGDTALSVALKHKSEIPQEPRKVNAQIPGDLNKVILKCMEKNREKRFKGADELLTELVKIEQGIPTAERVIPKRIPLTAKEITVQLKVKKLFVPAIVVIALVIIVLAVSKLIPKKQAVPIPSDKPSLAVMYFTNNTGDENLDHLRTMFSNLLIADITQSKYIRVLSEQKLYSILDQLNQLEAKSYSSDVLRDVAVRGGVSHILQGAYAKLGNEFRINVVLLEASTEETVGSETVQGEGEEKLFSMVDELTKKIKASFKLSEDVIAQDIDKEVGKITTSSPEALRYYIDARKYHNKGDYNQSIQLMKKAVAIDTEFAMAYKGIASSYHNLRRFSEERKQLQKALELIDRVSDRERYLIQGDFFGQSEDTYDKAIKAYNKLVQLYPDDRVANINLARMYMGLEEWDKSIERFEVLKQARIDSLFIYTNLAIVYWYEGDYGKAGEVLEFYLENFSDNIIIRGLLAYNYLFKGEYTSALTEVDNAISLDPTFPRNTYIKGDIYYVGGNFIEAEKEYQKLIGTVENAGQLDGRDRLGALYLSQGKFEKSESQIKQAIELAEKLGEKGGESEFHLQLAYRYIISGRFEEALEECEKAWSCAAEAKDPEYQRSVFVLKGLVYLGKGAMNEAQNIAAELKKLTQKGLHRKLIRDYHYLNGRKELKKNNFSRAIKEFEKALSLSSLQHSFSALYLDSLALAYYKAGDLDKAQEQYEKIISLTYGRISYGDIFARSFYMLGKICQEKGLKEKALEFYRKFLDLWESAGQDFPEIPDAREQLTALQTE
ncbi:MAG: protein kinase [Candidatus Aminicenantes bacterium]|nr:protein kinase [Candidatus Aminicenantes bacterium]